MSLMIQGGIGNQATIPPNVLTQNSLGYLSLLGGQLILNSLEVLNIYFLQLARAINVSAS